MSALEFPRQSAKKTIKIVAYFLFIVAYATVLSIGMESLLNLLGISMGIALDSGSSTNQYPKFIPFCVVVGFFSLASLVLLVILNVKVSERLDYTKKAWYIQSAFALIVSIPMIKLWEMLFEYLHKVF